MSFSTEQKNCFRQKGNNVSLLWVKSRGGVEDTRLEAKAKDQEHRGKCSPKNKVLKIFFRAISKKKVFKIFFQAISKRKGFQKPFQAISKKKGLQKLFSRDLQNFYDSKNSAALETRIGQFSST